MHKYCHKSTLLTVIGIAATHLLCVVSPSYALLNQGVTEVHSQLFLDFEKISNRYRVTITAEGDISEDSINNDASIKQNPHPLKLTGQSLTDDLSEVCSAYDLSWEQEGGVITVKKNFGRFERLPEMTLEEYMVVVKEMNNLLRPFQSHIQLNDYRHTEGINAFISSVTPEQMERMHEDSMPSPSVHDRLMNRQPTDTSLIPQLHSSFHTPQQAIPVSEWSTDQRTALQQIAVGIYATTALPYTNTLSHEAESILRDGARFCWREADGTKKLGYELEAQDKDGKRVFVPLIDIDRKNVQRAYEDPEMIVWQQSDRQIRVLPHSVSVAPIKTGHRSNADTGFSAGTMTLESAATLYTKDLPAHYVDSELNDKPVTMIGAPVLNSSEAVYRSLASVYGLRTRTLPNGSTHVSRITVHTPSNIQDLRRALWEAIPDPFLRDLICKTIPSSSPAFHHAGALITLDQITAAEQNPRNKVPWTLGVRLEGIKSAATAAVVQSVEPLIIASKDGFVDLSELDNRTRSAFAVLLMANLAESLHSVMFHPAPAYVTNFDQSAVQCQTKIMNGKNYFQINFFTIDPSQHHKLVVSFYGQPYNKAALESH